MNWRKSATPGAVPPTHTTHPQMLTPAYTGGVGQCTVYYDNVIVTKLD